MIYFMTSPRAPLNLGTCWKNALFVWRTNGVLDQKISEGCLSTQCWSSATGLSGFFQLRTRRHCGDDGMSSWAGGEILNDFCWEFSPGKKLNGTSTLRSRFFFGMGGSTTLPSHVMAGNCRKWMQGSGLVTCEIFSHKYWKIMALYVLLMLQKFPQIGPDSYGSRRFCLE